MSTSRRDPSWSSGWSDWVDLDPSSTRLPSYPSLVMSFYGVTVRNRLIEGPMPMPILYVNDDPTQFIGKWFILRNWCVININEAS